MGSDGTQLNNCDMPNQSVQVYLTIQLSLPKNLIGSDNKNNYWLVEPQQLSVQSEYKSVYPGIIGSDNLNNQVSPYATSYFCSDRDPNDFV